MSRSPRYGHLTPDPRRNDSIDPGEAASVGVAEDGRPFTRLEELDIPEPRIFLLRPISGEPHGRKPILPWINIGRLAASEADV